MGRASVLPPIGSDDKRQPPPGQGVKRNDLLPMDMPVPGPTRLNSLLQ